MAVAFGQCALDAAKVRKGSVFFVENILDDRNVGAMRYALDKTFGDMPLFANHNEQFTVTAKCCFGLPKPRRKTASNAAPFCQEFEQSGTLVRNLEYLVFGRIEVA